MIYAMCTAYKTVGITNCFIREFYTVQDKSEIILDTMRKNEAIISIIELTEDEYNKITREIRE